MADWKDRLGPATFRKVSFFVDVTERSGGRAVVVHQYPFRNDPPYSEDMGAEGRAFPLEAYVVGHDYLSARDALLTALETEGPGTLVHPTYGTRRVVVKSYRVRESNNEGGMARFSLEFLETSGPAQPANTVDAKAAVTASAAAALSAVQSEFLAAYNKFATVRDGVTSALHAATGAINKVVDTVSSEGQAAAQLARSVANFAGSVNTLAGLPGNLFADQVAMFEDLASSLSASSSVDVTAAILAVYSFDPGARPSAPTPARAIDLANFDAAIALTKRIAVLQASRVALVQTFVSFDDAVRTRAAVIAAIDEQSASASDATYAAFRQLRADLVKAIPGDGNDLPRLLTYTAGVTLPSLVLAYRLYGDLDSEADLVARNKVRNPGFVPGSQELEILSRG